MKDAYEKIEVGDMITGKEMKVTVDKIQEFAEVTLDYNPLHLDDGFMGKTSFGKTKYEGIIGHGLLNFALVTRMMTDWLLPRGGVHRRLQTKHVKPVYSDDVLTPKAKVIRKTKSKKTRWVLFEVELRKHQGDVVVLGDALAEFPKEQL